MPQADPPPAREGLGLPPKAVVLPLLVLLALFAVWSAIWYEGTRRAEIRLDQWLLAEADRGRVYDCAERRIGGYPFRVEVACRSPSVTLSDASPQLRTTATRMRAVAMVWQLEHVIVEIDGPLRVENSAGDGPGTLLLEADWSVLQSSFRVPRGRIAQSSVVIEDARIIFDMDSSEASGGVTLTADQLDLHQRQAPGGAETEIAVSAHALIIAHHSLQPADEVDLALLARVIGLPDPMPRQPADILAAWRADEGSFDVTELRAVQGDSVIRAEGRISSDRQGRPEGAITVSLAGPDVAAPGETKAFAGIAPALATALRLAGRRAELDGRDAVSGDLQLRDGRVFFGPFPLLDLPVLF